MSARTNDALPPVSAVPSDTAPDNGPAPGPAPLPPQLDRYRILGVLGQGGFGVVYRAEQDSPRREVALKVLHPGRAGRDGVRRFEFEAQALARMQHDGIARVYDAGVAGDVPFLAMELIDGRPLTAYAADAGLDLRGRARLLADIADAVHHAHTKGVVHRDLKPNNILVTPAGQPKVLDFGIARLTDGDEGHTATGVAIGTPAYMSPEQATGAQDEVDTRSDVYTLGVVGYELLAGRMPYDLDPRNWAQVARTIAEREPTPPPEVGGDLSVILLHALEKDRARRYPSAAELAADLRRFLADEPIQARPASLLYRARKFARRNRTLVGAALVVAVAVLAGLVTTTWFALRERAAKDEVRGQLAASEVQRGEMAMQRGEWAEALDAYGRGVDGGHPETAAIRLDRARARYGLSDTPAMLRELDAVDAAGDATDEQRARARLLRGDMLFVRSGKVDEARGLIRQALAGPLPPAEKEYALALVADTTPKMMAQLERCLELDGWHLPARYGAVTMCFHLGDLDRAGALIETGAAMFPKDRNFPALAAFRAALRGDGPATGRALAAAQPHFRDKKEWDAVKACVSAFADVGRMRAGGDTLDFLRLQAFLQTMLLQAHLEHGGPDVPGLSMPPLIAASYGRFVQVVPRSLPPLHRIAFLGVINLIAARLSLPAVMSEKEDPDGSRELARAAEVHPDGVFFYFLGKVHERAGRRDQAALAFAEAARRPSMIPVRRMALAAGADVAFDLASKADDASRPAKRVRYAEVVTEGLPGLSPNSVGADEPAWFAENAGRAVRLEAFDLGRVLLSRWEQRSPAANAGRQRVRIELEAKAGNPAKAIELGEKFPDGAAATDAQKRAVKATVEEARVALRKQAERLAPPVKTAP